jgi:hypothetical protein
MPHLTSTAGRHAADLARRRAALNAAEARRLVDDEAREQLRRSIAGRGISCIDQLRDGEHQLFARCRVDTCFADGELIDALITDAGFELDPGRISRFRDRFEYIRLLNPATGARVVMVISRPGALHRAEAA